MWYDNSSFPISVIFQEGWGQFQVSEIANVMLSVLDDSNVMVAWSYQTQRNSRSIHHWKRPMWINKKNSECLLLCILILQLHIKNDAWQFCISKLRRYNPQRSQNETSSLRAEWVIPPSKMVSSMSKPILPTTTNFYIETFLKVSFYPCLSKTQHLSLIEVEQSKSSREAHCDHCHLHFSAPKPEVLRKRGKLDTQLE